MFEGHFAIICSLHFQAILRRREEDREGSKERRKARGEREKGERNMIAIRVTEDRMTKMRNNRGRIANICQGPALVKAIC